MRFENFAELSGVALRGPFLLDEKRYVTLGALRRSGVCDVITVLLPEGIGENVCAGGKVRVFGSLRGRNAPDGRLRVMVVAEKLYSFTEDVNEIRLYGALCRPPRFRRTPGGRMLCEFMVAQGKNHFPCLTWGEEARRVANISAGTHVSLCGRLQSREYVKTDTTGRHIVQINEISAESVEECLHLGKIGV